MPQVNVKVVAGGKPARILLELASVGPAGLTQREFQVLGILVCGTKLPGRAATNQLLRNGFFERRVVLTAKGQAEVARLESERKAAEDAAFLETRNYG